MNFDSYFDLPARESAIDTYFEIVYDNFTNSFYSIIDNNEHYTDLVDNLIYHFYKNGFDPIVTVKLVEKNLLPTFIKHEENNND
jgi:hypothetical protein